MFDGRWRTKRLHTVMHSANLRFTGHDHLPGYPNVMYNILQSFGIELGKACHDFHMAGEASGNVIAVGDDDGMVNLYRLTGTLGAWLMQPRSKLTLQSKHQPKQKTAIIQ